MTDRGEPSAFQRIFGAVKHQGGKGRWQGSGALGIVVGFAALAAALAAPRATEPDVLPLPIPDRSVLRRVRAASEALAGQARVSGLAYDVRAVGEAIRRHGAASVEGKGVPEPVIGEVRRSVMVARERKSERGLLALLALQTELFIEATRAFEVSGKPSVELGELGGDFALVARQNGWMEGRRIVLDEQERAALFRLRWTELTGLRSEAAFAPTLDEYRAYYALHLRPSGEKDQVPTDRGFSVVRALEKRDPSYPAAFARGVLFYRAGLFLDAADAFRTHLSRYPDGPWTLRAKNHVLAALAQGTGAD